MTNDGDWLRQEELKSVVARHKESAAKFLSLPQRLPGWIQGWHQRQKGLDLLRLSLNLVTYSQKSKQESSNFRAGSSSIIHETTHQPLLSLLSSIVETVVQLKKQGHRVVLVSSGAIAVGVKRMELKARPKTVSGKQVRLYYVLVRHYMT